MKNHLFTAIFAALLLSLVSCGTEKGKKVAATEPFRFEEFTITQFQEGYANGDFTVTDVVQAYLDRIGDIDDSGPMLNAVIEVNPDALAIAAELDAELKDAMCGVRCTEYLCCSKTT